VLPIKAKSDIFEAFKQFKAYAENQSERKIKILRDDKEGEYMSKAFLDFTTHCGIERQHTVRARPQQNGVAERANRVLSERLTTMLDESGLAKAFWGECLGALVHVWNRCSTDAVKKNPSLAVLFSGLFQQKPDVSHLRVWGCTAYVHIQKDKRAGLNSHMEKCVFIGYPQGYKGWKFYNPTMTTPPPVPRQSTPAPKPASTSYYIPPDSDDSDSDDESSFDESLDHGRENVLDHTWR